MQSDESKWQAMLDDLHATAAKIAVVVAGGGSGAIHQCFRREGASQTFVEAVIPYSRAAMAEYLGEVPIDSNASLQTAKQLAERAYHRAGRLCDEQTMCDGGESDVEPVGLSLVAALPTHPPRRGDDRIHVALHSREITRQWSLKLAKDSFSRSVAETISDEMLFKAMSTLVANHNNDVFFIAAGLTVEAS